MLRAANHMKPCFKNKNLNPKQIKTEDKNQKKWWDGLQGVSSSSGWLFCSS